MATKKKEEEKKVTKIEEKEQNKLVSLLELIGIVIAVIVILVFFPGSVIWNITILLLILSALIFVHEGGHFIVGKMCGVHIYEFALGMGPKIISYKRKNDPTEYTLRAFPIGGFCAMAGEEGEDDENLPKEKFMCNKSKLQRTAILVAGVTMNFITAIILLFFISFIWGSTEQHSIVGYVQEDSPAEVAGIKKGDRIVECNGYKVNTWDELSIVGLLKNNNEYYTYVVEHKDGKRETYKIIPDEYITVGEEQIKLTEEYTLDDAIKEHKLKKDSVIVQHIIGVGQNNKREKGFVNAISYAFVKFVTIVKVMLLTIVSLFTGKLGLDALSGPVGMYSVVGTVAKYGIANILYLTAYLSVNLGVMNILPFPAFDGGRVLFVGIEAITRKKVNPRVEGIFHTIGFILLMILMVIITFKDILKIV